LNLMNPSKPEAVEFKARFPHLAIMQPEGLLQLLRENTAG